MYHLALLAFYGHVIFRVFLLQNTKKYLTTSNKQKSAIFEKIFENG